MEFPNALLGIALGTILLPSLSKAHANNDDKEYSSLMDWGLRLTFLLAMPASILLMTLAVPFTATLFNYGKFNAVDVNMTAYAVIAYGVGLIGLIVVRILAPGFYAKQDIRTPVKIAVFVLILTQLMNLFFVPIFAHAGLALSIGIGACGNAAILFYMLRKKGIYQPEKGWKIFFLKLAVALVLLAVVSIWSASYFDWIGMQAHPLYRMGALAIVMIVCGVVYFGALLLLGFRIRLSPDCPIASSIFRFGFEFFPADHAIHQLFLDFDKTLVKAFTFRRIFFIKLRVVQACGNLVLFIFKR